MKQKHMFCMSITFENQIFLSSVRGTGPAVSAPLLAGAGGLQNLEGAHEGVVDGHHGAGVVELAAVVGSGEDGNKLAAGEELSK